jgi:hypothetical protein
MLVDLAGDPAFSFVTMSAQDRLKALIAVQTQIAPDRMRKKRWGPARI